MATVCPVDDCPKQKYRGGYCYAHYMKKWRYGTPTPTHAPRWEDFTGRRFGQLVAIARVDGRWVLKCDCGKETRAASGDLNRGTKITCGDRRAHRRLDPGYGAAHERVRRDRGHAQAHPCIDCGGRALQWSYTHDDPNELVVPGGVLAGIAYSADVNRYAPRCVPCHKRFDLGRPDAAEATA